MAAKVLWIFTCGHSALQFKDETNDLAPMAYNIKYKSVREEIHAVCPSCFRSECQATAANRVAARDDEQTLAAYQSQSTFIKQQIKDAGNNKELSNDLGKTLLACEQLWAKKIRQIEAKTSTTIGPYFNETFVQRLDTAIHKLQLLNKGELATCSQLRNISKSEVASSVLGQSPAYEQSIRKLESWMSILGEMQSVKSEYKDRIKPGLEEMEMAYEETWAKALDLMKT